MSGWKNTRISLQDFHSFIVTVLCLEEGWSQARTWQIPHSQQHTYLESESKCQVPICAHLCIKGLINLTLVRQCQTSYQAGVASLCLQSLSRWDFLQGVAFADEMLTACDWKLVIRADFRFLSDLVLFSSQKYGWILLGWYCQCELLKAGLSRSIQLWDLQDAARMLRVLAGVAVSAQTPRPPLSCPRDPT